LEIRHVKSMEEFATLSGISRPTLSKYFHDPDSVRPSTRARIETALQRYDYRPNIYAINQNRKLTKNIGIVVPYLADPFFAEIARNLERRCIEAGFWPILFSSHGDRQLENNILDSLGLLKPAGVLLGPLGRASDRGAVEKFCRDVPTVLFDANIEGVGKAFVGSDNFQSVPLMVEYLCSTGAPPCWLEMPPVNPNANKRREAYRQAMEQRGHTPHIVRIDGDDWNFERIGHTGGLKVIEQGLLPSDTVFCSNDRLAVGFLAACYEKGLRVGRGAGCALRIAGHDDHPSAEFTCPPLTTIAQDYGAISRTAAQTLFALIEGEETSDRPEILFEGSLVRRASA